MLLQRDDLFLTTWGRQITVGTSLLTVPGILLLLSVDQLQLILRLLHAFLEKALDDLISLLAAKLAHRGPIVCALGSDLH